MARAYVLLLDLVGSSRMEDRQRATTAIQNAQEAVNRELEGAFLAPLETTRGDETAAVLRDPRVAYDAIAALGDDIHPLSLRAVVKYGELVAGLDTRRASIIDGPAFQLADEQMNALKDGPALCRFDLGFADLDHALTALGNLLLTQLADLTELQRKILRQYQRSLEAGSGARQERVAETVGSTQQNVSKTLRAIRWELIDDAEAAMRRLLADAANRREEVS